MEYFIESFNEFVNQRKGDGLIVAQVTTIDRENFLFDCKDADGNEYLDVRINATPLQTGVLIVPNKGASVIIYDLGMKGQEYVMMQAGEIEQVIFNADNFTEVVIDQSQVRLGNNNIEKAVLGESLNTNLNNLMDKLDELLNALQTFSTSQTGVTASGPLAPLNPAYSILTPKIVTVKAALNTIKTQFNDHLSDVVKIGN